MRRLVGDGGGGGSVCLPWYRQGSKRFDVNRDPATVLDPKAQAVEGFADDVQGPDPWETH